MSWQLRNSYPATYTHTLGGKRNMACILDSSTKGLRCDPVVCEAGEFLGRSEALGRALDSVSTSAKHPQTEFVNMRPNDNNS